MPREESALDILIRQEAARMTRSPQVGPSEGAVAREVCRSLDPSSPTRLLLEALLGNINFGSSDRAQILDDIRTHNYNVAVEIQSVSNQRWIKRGGQFRLPEVEVEPTQATPTPVEE